MSKQTQEYPEGIVYERRRAIHYNVINPVHKRNDYGPPTIKQGVSLFFKPKNDHTQRSEFDPTAYTEEWVHNEIVSGNIDGADEKAVEKKKKEIYQLICRFVENHKDFNQKMVTRKPTKEEIAENLRQRQKELQGQIDELEGKISDPEKIDEEKDVPMPPPEKNPMVKGGGVSQGGATMRNTRGR